MLLYQATKGLQIKAKTSKDGILFKDDIITFDHLDGMYSYCTTSDGSIIHLGRFTPLRKVGEYYEIDVPKA